MPDKNNITAQSRVHPVNTLQAQCDDDMIATQIGYELHDYSTSSTFASWHSYISSIFI